VGLITEDKSDSIPPLEMVSKDFDDLRSYMPKLSFTSDRKMRLQTSNTPLDIHGEIVAKS
jgi:hypothetical protein